MNLHIKTIPLESISDNNTYRYSYRKVSDDLINSIAGIGVIKPPVLFKEKNRLIVVDGFNRIEALKKLNKKDVPALVREEFIAKDFVQNILQKHYDTGLAPSERLGFIYLCNKLGSIPEDKYHSVAQWMGIPDTFLHDSTLIDVFNSLNPELRAYLDTRAISFKTLHDLCGLTNEVIDLIDLWIAQCDFRVNIFKSIIELLDDIYRIGSKNNVLQSFIFNHEHDNRTREQSIYDFLMAVRYPEYIHRREEVENLLKQVHVKGIAFKYDNSFENNWLELKIQLNKKNTIDDIIARLGSINPVIIKKILSQL